MKPAALTKAKARLARAKAALAELESSKSLSQHAADWTDFLLAANAIFTCLEQGAKSSQRSTDWFAKKKGERRRDPLLRYLHQARNSDEHGIEGVLERQEAKSPMIGSRDKPLSGRIAIDVGGKRLLHDLGSEPVTVRLVGSRMCLAPVNDARSGMTFYPPNEHLGQPVIDGNSARVVARAAAAYLSSMIVEAEALEPAG